jgi:hypothetical protein
VIPNTRTFLFAAIFAASALTQPTDGRAATAFDGPWSVVVYTLVGQCDPSARFSGQIVNGEISYAYGSLDVTGHVEANGFTRVHVIYGTAHGEAHGRLTATQGSGTWSGDGPEGRCSGTWSATRK